MTKRIPLDRVATVGNKKFIVLALALSVLGTAALAAGVPHSAALGLPREVWVTVGCVQLVTAVLIGLTAVNRAAPTPALLRVDHFLPFLRKKRYGGVRPPGLAARWARRVLPAVLFADVATGRPGWIRQILQRFGPTVVSSPLRRVVQGLCLLLYLWLFFHVCWPYSAMPGPAGAVSSGWRMDQIEQPSGNFRFHGGGDPQWQPPPRQRVWIVDDRAPDAIRGDMGEFHVVSSSASHVTVQPRESLSDTHLDAFLLGTGTWSFHERSPWPSHYTDELVRKELLPADLFLAIDPLVSLSTAVASRSWVWSLASAVCILIVCILVPRGFCGYLCPLGTVIDLFDWGVSQRVRRFRVADEGWWVHLKYYLLLGTLVCAVSGVLVSGYVAAIPVVTRAMLFLGDPLQSGLRRGWGHVPPWNVGHLFSLVLFLAVLGLGLLQPRFWCKYVCPSGAVFSLGNVFRVTQRKVENTCIHCNKCVQICPFDAIKADFTTRVSDCTLCQTCAGVCPTHAIKFVERWNLVELKTPNVPPTHETLIGRRSFVSWAAGTAAAVAGGAGIGLSARTFGAKPQAAPPIRPPGSVPEREFLQMCIRCGECFKACPYNVLQPLGFEQGLDALWTPQVVADHAGCAPSCNACGQVCPTGAIRELALAEKKVARMGLAIVNQRTCLPYANREACQLCVDECTAAGYHALEFTRVHTEVGSDGQPVEGSGYLAPVVLADRCVGCGLCQMSCYQFNVKQKPLLDGAAIVVVAGDGKEDRILAGSYRELRQKETRQRANALQPGAASGNDYFVPNSDQKAADPFGRQPDDSPFGEVR